MSSTNEQVLDGDEAYLSFGGWAKAMPDPPSLNERRRYTVDVQCTEAAIKTSDKGDRYIRKLSILRVSEVKGVSVPPKDVDENQAALYDDDGYYTGDDDGEKK